MNAPLPLQPTPEAAARPATVVCLSVPFDLKKIFGGLDDARLVLRDPEEIERPEDVTAALCWNPADDAFDRFPNIRLAASIAAGVDGILACPSLPAGAVVTRVRDDAQADLMAGYAAFAVAIQRGNVRKLLEFFAEPANVASLESSEAAVR